MANITLVDDDENIVASVSLALESLGHNVKAYFDGASGLAALEAEQPDLAILDVKMPRMDGMEVLRRLRQTSDVPVIFLTSKDEEIDEILGFNLGADDYIHKPFSQRLLLERVKARLGPAASAHGGGIAPAGTSSTSVTLTTITAWCAVIARPASVRMCGAGRPSSATASASDCTMVEAYCSIE